MKEYNDQAEIAEQFTFTDTHIKMVASLAFQKVTTLRLSRINAAFCNSYIEMKELVNRTLLNYVSPDFVLAEEGFFDDEFEN